MDGEKRREKLGLGVSGRKQLPAIGNQLLIGKEKGS